MVLFAIVGELGCHSEDTLVLTPNGIKNYKELKVGDKVLGIDKWLKIKETPIKKIFEYDYEGKMIHFKSLKFDFLVTPNHRMLFKTLWIPYFEYRRAEELLNYSLGYFPASFSSDGEILKEIMINGKSYDTNLLLKLGGLYIAEGSILSSKNGKYKYVVINNQKHIENIKELVNKLGLKFSVYEGRKVVIWDSNIGKFFIENFGVGALNKTISETILNLSPIHTLNLFEGMMLGDGSYNQRYYTISKSLFEKFIILCLKLGFGISFNIKKPQGKKSYINGRVIESKHNVYEIGVSFYPRNYITIKPNSGFNEHKNVEIVDYKGKVWCFETDLGNFFTVRNGKIGVSGNSGKSTTMVYLAWKNWFFRRKKIFANLHLFKIPYIYIDKIPQMTTMREGVCAFDELWRVCVHPKTLIFTHNNIVHADSSFFSNPFLSVDENLKLNESIVTHQFKNFLLPNEKLIKISTRTKEIITSKDHIFFTINRDPNFFCRHKGIKDIKKFVKEKRASEIRKYDRVLTLFKAKEPEKELIDKKTAQLIGYIFADGHINYPHRSTIQIDDCSLKCLEKYKKIAEELGFGAYIKKHKGKNLYRLLLTGKEKIIKIVEEISDSLELSKFKCSSFFFKDIPKKIVESNNKVLGAFLRGFFDGEACVKIDKAQKKFIKIEISIKKKDILEKIKYLLLRFGITSSNIKKLDNNGYDIYKFIISDSLSLELFRKFVGFSHPDKKIKLRLIKKFKTKSKRKIFGNVEVEMVTKVEEINPNCEYLIDFSVPYFNNYIANGFIVHNCDSRLTRSEMNKITSDILSRSRKRHLTYLFTAQLIDSIDKRIRKVIDFTALPIMNPTETVCKVLVFRSGYPKEGMHLKTFYFKTPLIFKCFDSILPDQKIFYFNDNNLHISEVKNFNGDIKNILIPTLNLRTMKMELKKPKAFIKHFVKKDGYEITTTYNRKIKVTGDHSLYSYKNGEIKLIPVRNLKVGDSILIAKTLPVVERDIKELNIAEIIEEVWKKKKYNYNILVKTKFNNNELLKISKNYKMNYLYKKKSYLPYNIAKKLNLVKKNMLITSRYLDKTIPITIKVNAKFLWLLGLILAEGSISENRLTISTEEKLLDRAEKIIKKIFKVNINRSPPQKGRSGTITIWNRAISLFVKSILDNYGWIIQLPKRKLKWFLYGYWQGDGYHKGNYKIFKCITSKKKVFDIITAILGRFGIVWSVTNTKSINNYYLIQASVRPNILNFDKKIKQKIREKIINDCIIVKIKKIKKFQIRDYVYDFSIEGNQNFLSNDFIIAKNTDEEIDMNPEDDYSEPKIVFQENFNREHGYWCECRECGTKFFNTWEEADKYAERYWMSGKAKVSEIL